jgi:hypothetical protein
VRTGVTEEDMAIIKPTDMITVIEGYDAMRIFLKPFGFITQLLKRIWQPGLGWIPSSGHSDRFPAQ